MTLGPLDRWIITSHARFQMQRRSISMEEIDGVLRSPEQCDEIGGGRRIYQGRVEAGAGEKLYLLRVFVDMSYSPPHVVTVYRTSKVEKYLGQEP
ncbi:MAG: DUF4258 domain-containing protein [Nitrospinota bacterium]